MALSILLMSFLPLYLQFASCSDLPPNFQTIATLGQQLVHKFDINTTDDYCSIDVQIYGALIWESPCAKISKANNCSVALSKDGNLQVLDGSSAAWSTSTSGKGVQSLQLLNSGDLALLDSSNGVVWKSSDHYFKNGDELYCSVGTPMGAPTPGSQGSSDSPSAEGPALAYESSASSLMPSIIAIFLAAAAATLFLG